MQLQNYSGPKIVSRRLPITALPPSWYKIKFQPKPPKKYWPKMGVGRVLKLVIIVSLCIIAMFICTFENILFRIGRLTNIESFLPTFSHLIALYVMKFWRQNSKIYIRQGNKMKQIIQVFPKNIKFRLSKLALFWISQFFLWFSYFLWLTKCSFPFLGKDICYQTLLERKFAKRLRVDVIYLLNKNEWRVKRLHFWCSWKMIIKWDWKCWI